MTDDPTPDSNLDTNDTSVEPDRGSTSGTTRWQKVVGIIGLLVLLWVGSQMFGTMFGGGGGGPGGGGHVPPEGGH